MRLAFQNVGLPTGPVPFRLEGIHLLDSLLVGHSTFFIDSDQNMPASGKTSSSKRFRLWMPILADGSSPISFFVRT